MNYELCSYLLEKRNKILVAILFVGKFLVIYTASVHKYERHISYEKYNLISD